SARRRAPSSTWSSPACSSAATTSRPATPSAERPGPACATLPRGSGLRPGTWLTPTSLVHVCQPPNTGIQFLHGAPALGVSNAEPGSAACATPDVLTLKNTHPTLTPPLHLQHPRLSHPQQDRHEQETSACRCRRRHAGCVCFLHRQALGAEHAQLADTSTRGDPATPGDRNGGLS